MMRAKPLNLAVIGALLALGLTACGQQIQAGASGTETSSGQSAGSSEQSTDPLTSITPAELAATGVNLAPATGLTSSITEQQADAASEKEMPGDILEARFFHCSRPDIDGFNGACWAVSTKPPPGDTEPRVGGAIAPAPSSEPPIRTAFQLVLVNAADGSIIVSFDGSDQTSFAGNG